MSKRTLSNVKLKFTAVIAVIMVLCVGLVVFGCGKDESDYEYAMRIAKEEFGCKRILWYAGASYRSELTNIYLYDEHGKISPFPTEYFDPRRGGDYVLGIDEFGNEKFIVIPDQESVKSGMRYSPRLIQWPFAYSFTEIANLAAEYGYKYADGIEGREQEYLKNCLNYEAFIAVDREDELKSALGYYAEQGAEYDKIDVKFALEFRHIIDNNNIVDYLITQENGRLKIYENKRSELENIINVITYVRNKKTEE